MLSMKLFIQANTKITQVSLEVFEPESESCKMKNTASFRNLVFLLLIPNSAKFE